jgi:hypothetical protein
MINKSILQNIFIAITFVCLTASAAFAQTTAFTYQGKLTNNGTPATGTYEMRFTLYDLPAGGFEFGTPKTISNIFATNGIFTVVIPTGDWSFDQSERFMEIAVRPQGDVNPFTVLAPLQQITNAPKAIFANTAALAGFSASSGNAASLSGLGVEQFVLKNVNGEIVAPRFENLAADPEPAAASNTGRVYFNTTTNSLMVSNGTAWIDLTPTTRQIQTFYANTNYETIPCTSNIRSVTFTKNVASTRLRVTYRDSPFVGHFAFFSGFDVVVKIDGAMFSPVSLSNGFSSVAGGGGSYTGGGDMTIVGYAEGISAGTHVLTTNYGPFLLGAPGCQQPRKYLIEIEEIP